MRAGAEFDILVAVFHPVHDRNVGGHAEITGYVEHPDPPSGIGKLDSHVTDIGVIELAEIDFRTTQAVVPPNRIGIAFDELQEALDDGLLSRVAGRAAIGISMKVPVKEIQQTRRQKTEAPITQ